MNIPLCHTAVLKVISMIKEIVNLEMEFVYLLFLVEEKSEKLRYYFIRSVYIDQNNGLDWYRYIHSFYIFFLFCNDKIQRVIDR